MLPSYLWLLYLSLTGAALHGTLVVKVHLTYRTMLPKLIESFPVYKEDEGNHDMIDGYQFWHVNTIASASCHLKQ